MPRCPYCQKDLRTPVERCPHCNRVLRKAISDPDDVYNKGPFIIPNMRPVLRVYGIILTVVFILIARGYFHADGVSSIGGWFAAGIALLAALVTFGRGRKASVHLIVTPLQVIAGGCFIAFGWWNYLKQSPDDIVGWILVSVGAVLLILIGRGTIRGGPGFDGLPA